MGVICHYDTEFSAHGRHRIRRTDPVSKNDRLCQSRQHVSRRSSLDREFVSAASVSKPVRAAADYCTRPNECSLFVQQDTGVIHHGV